MSPPTRATTSRWWWGATAAGVAVLAGVATAVALSVTQPRPAPTVLDITATHRQIEEVLRDPLDGYAAETVTSLVCNDGLNPTITAGAEFTCEAVVDGIPRRVAVVFQDDLGTYAVDRPR